MEPPHPALQAAGVNMGIQEFNAHVQAVVESHRHGLGRDPSPGLVLDVVRSQVPLDDYGKLFQLPQNQRQARLSGVVANAHRHDLLMVQRGDGLLEVDTPFRRMFQAAAQAATQPLPGQPPAGAKGPLRAAPSVGQLQKQHPWVATGFLPVDHFGALVAALNALAAPDEQAKVTHGGYSLEQFQKEYEKSMGEPLPTQTEPGKISSDLGTVAPHVSPEYAQERRGFDAVTTVKGAQRELNGLMGTKLPETGFINDDWARAISNWQKSAAYFHRTTQFLADKNGLSVPDFISAWKNQQQAVRTHPLSAHFYASLPLAVFVHGRDWAPIPTSWKSAKDLGGYLGGGGKTPIDVALHGMTRSAGMLLGGIGGTVQSFKADSAAADAFAQDLAAHGRTHEEALAHARKVLHENPSWLRVVDPSLPAHPHGLLKAIDNASNIAVDLIVLRKPGLTGETVGYGDLAGAMKSGYVRASSQMAYGYLQEGKLARASSMLEGGAGAERLAKEAEPLVKAGKLTPEAFRQHVAELYAHGETKLGAASVHGAVLDSLRSPKLPTPGPAGMAVKRVQANVRDVADRFDTLARRNDLTAGFANAVSFARAMVAHAVAPGKHGFFDPRLPERVHDWTLSTFKEAEYANKMEARFVRARATGDVPGMKAVFDDLTTRYHAAFPVGTRPPNPEPFQALLDTEAPGMAVFPSGGRRERSGLSWLPASAQSVSRALNRVAQIQTQAILSGAPLFYAGGYSLFWKHLIGDTMRRAVGGGFDFPRFLLGHGLEDATGKFQALRRANPDVERAYGAFLERSTEGETRWLLDRGQAVNRRAFSTGEAFGKSNYMEQAGSYLRRVILSDALPAYQASTAADLSPLVQAVLHNRTLRGLWHDAQSETPGLSAEEYAQLLHNRFREFEQAAHTAGVQDPFGEALAVARKHVGAKSATRLGAWIRANGIDFPVYGARPAQSGVWDELTGNAIRRIMTFNKWNRGGMARNLFMHHFDQALKAGWEPKAAAHVAMGVAERQTVYHMLDFANRLKVEQDLRWLSYFATKHRLYWKWTIGTLARNPNVAAAIDDFRQHLDEHGNIDLGLSLFGLDLKIPAARLVWVPGREYSEVSPLVTTLAKTGATLAEGKGIPDAIKAGMDAAAGTSGNLLTRQDTSLNLLVHAGLAMAGGTAATYGGASAYMDKRHREAFNQAVNEFQLGYLADHGHYAPESYVVKHVLWKMTAEELWRANLPLPVVPERKQNASQRLMAQFMSLIEPAKRARFLHEHPGFRDQLGVWSDPQTFLYNREFFARYTAQHDGYRAARQAIYRQAVASGYFSPELALRKRQLDKAYEQGFNAMLVEDAKKSGVYAGGVPDGSKDRPYGRWGKVIEADPLVNPQTAVRSLFPNVKASEQGKVIGALQHELERELKVLDDPKVAATYDDPNEIKTRRREILQQLDAYRAYPKDALGRVQLDYIEHAVNPYWKQYERRYQQIHAAPRDRQAELKADFYTWRDQQDKPVVEYVDGHKITFPSRPGWRGRPSTR